MCIYYATLVGFYSVTTAASSQSSSVGASMSNKNLTLPLTRISGNGLQQIGHDSRPQYAHRTYQDLSGRDRRDAPNDPWKFQIRNRLTQFQRRFTLSVHNYLAVHNLDETKYSYSGGRAFPARMSFI